MKRFLIPIILLLISFTSFAGTGARQAPPGVKLGIIKDTLQSDVYVLSIGISDYDMGPYLSFTNCNYDAQRFTMLIREQHKALADDSSQFFAYELLDGAATYQNIIDHLNLVISQAQPEDYFFFNFSGFSWPVPDSTGQEEICFFPYFTEEIRELNAESLASVTDRISLHQLRDLMEFIPAQNQLIVTEAGMTPNFKRDFAKAMIETSPSIAEIAQRNRVIIVPEEFGMDVFRCNGQSIQGGPIMHFLVEAGREVSLFDLFSDDEKVRNSAKYGLMRQEFTCEEFSSPYMSFFFEREFVKDMKYYVGDYGMQSRGTGVLSIRGEAQLDQVGHPYALVIGTNNYSNGAPQWKDLSNPAEDANVISSVLKDVYGYQVRTLYDPAVDTLIAALKQYSRILNEEDQFILFIAGHGDYDPYFFDDGFLVMSNSLATSKDPYRRTYLPFTQLRNIVDNLPARQILLMIDVCFGGAFDEKISAGPGRSGSSPYADVPIDRLIKDKLPLKTRIVLSSGSLNEVPDGYEGKHSPFAARIINCLNTRGGENGFLTTIQLFDFVQRLPSKPVRGELQGNEGGAEFFLIAR
jgi:hypothetical protein